MKKHSIGYFILLIIVGAVIGGFIGTLASNVSWLSFLSYGQSFNIGYPTPFNIDLGILKMSIGFKIDISIAMILGILVTYIVYIKFLRKK